MSTKATGETVLDDRSHVTSSETPRPDVFHPVLHRESPKRSGSTPSSVPFYSCSSGFLFHLCRVFPPRSNFRINNGEGGEKRRMNYSHVRSIDRGEIYIAYLLVRFSPCVFAAE